MKRSPLKSVSHRQALLNARWSKIKKKKLLRQLDEIGYTFCEVCGLSTNWLELDHVVSRAQGGPYTEANAQLLCKYHHDLKTGRLGWSAAE